MGSEAHGPPDCDKPTNPNHGHGHPPHDQGRGDHQQQHGAHAHNHSHKNGSSDHAKHGHDDHGGHGHGEPPAFPSDTELARRSRQFAHPKAQRVFLPRASVIIPNEKLSFWKLFAIFLSALALVLLLGLTIMFWLYQEIRHENAELREYDDGVTDHNQQLPVAQPPYHTP